MVKMYKMTSISFVLSAGDVDVRDASSIYIKTAFFNLAQSFVYHNSDHMNQDGKTQTSSVQGLLQRDEK